MISILSYRGSQNLGDAIQTLALARLLRGQAFSFRERDTGCGSRDDDTHICNGYLDGRWRPSPAARVVFAGVHVTSEAVAAKIKNMADASTVVGARDPHTHELLLRQGVQAEIIGCATLTLPRYEGPRAGVVHIDDGHCGQITQVVAADAQWESQWWRATERLLLLQRAELVVTTRLHVALPCLACSTPVLMPANTPRRVHEPGRLSLLDALGFEYGTPQLIDVSAFAARYVAFLSRHCSPALTLADSHEALGLVTPAFRPDSQFGEARQADPR